MTREEAIELYNSNWWKAKSSKEIVEFQLYEDRLCMPFNDFHKAVEEALDRPVWTHEFAYRDSMIAEFEGKISKPSMVDILNKIPADKQVIGVVV